MTSLISLGAIRCHVLTPRLSVQAMSSRSKSRRQEAGKPGSCKDAADASIASAYARVTDTGAVSVAIRCKPGAKRAAITDIGNVVGVAINAPPRDGEANEAVLDYIAEVVGVKKRQVSLLQGSKSREKVLLVEGSSQESIHEALEAACFGPRK